MNIHRQSANFFSLSFYHHHHHHHHHLSACDILRELIFVDDLNRDREKERKKWLGTNSMWSYNVKRDVDMARLLRLNVFERWWGPGPLFYVLLLLLFPSTYTTIKKAYFLLHRICHFSFSPDLILLFWWVYWISKIPNFKGEIWSIHPTYIELFFPFYLSRDISAVL